MAYLTEKARAGNRRRVKAWRIAHKDEYNRRMREYRTERKSAVTDTAEGKSASAAAPAQPAMSYADRAGETDLHTAGAA